MSAELVTPAPSATPAASPPSSTAESATQDLTELFDVVIENARVMDPASGRDERGMNVAIRGHEVRAITSRAIPNARARIDAAGRVVAPGFIDILSYDPNPRGSWNKLADGVTTNLALHAGAINTDAWYSRIAAQHPPLNYGATFFYGAARTQRMVPRNRPASPAQIRALTQTAARALDRGALGVAVSLEYYPGISTEEVRAMLTVAHAHHATTFFHVRYSDIEPPGTNIEALTEVLDGARATGASVHIDHLTSTGGLLSMTESLALIDAARAQGVDVTACMYPYNSWATFLNSWRFAPGWQQRFRLDYGDLQLGGSSERLTPQSFARYRAEGRLAVAPGIPETEVLAALREPYVMIASDAILEPTGHNHPRASGTFARTLGVYVRERRALSLMEALRRMSYLPAQRLASVAPAMARKGRLSVGADADLVVFDPERVRDRATVEHPELPSEGIDWVLVMGTVVLAPDGPRQAAHPGEAVRGDITAR